MPKENIFSTSDCLSSDTIFKYLNDRLSLKERHKVEKHMLECEFCSEALEGYSLLDKRDKAPVIISELNKSIKYKSYKFDIRKVAAGVAAVVVLAGGIVYLNYNTSKNTQVAVSKVEKPNKSLLKPDDKPVENSTQVPIAIEAKPERSKERNAKRDKYAKITINPGEVSSDGYLIEKQTDIPALSKEDNLLNKNSVSSSSIKKEELKDKSEKPMSAGMVPVEHVGNEELEEVQLESIQDVSNREAVTAKKNKVRTPAANSKSSKADLGYESKREGSVSSLEVGIQKYEDKKFVEASIIFESIIKVDSTNFKAIYYNGLSYLELGELNGAFRNFEKVPKGDKFFEEARWHKAMILIKKGDKSGAKVILNEIGGSNGPYKQKAWDELKGIE